MKVQVAIGVKGLSSPGLITAADSTVKAMTNNPLFADAFFVAQIEKTSTASTNLQDILSSPMSNTKTDDTKVAREALERHYSKLANMVVDAANDPSVADANRESIIHSAALTLKEAAHPQKRVFSVSCGEVSGSVDLIAAGGASAHEWQYTTDVVNFSNRVFAEATSKASTTITGLNKRTDYAFFHHAIVPGETTAWEGPIKLFVL